jgi:HlyD family secretion protein
MKTKTILVPALLVAAIAAGGWWWADGRGAGSGPAFRTAKVERGTLTATVAASGTLAPTVQVQVGSQISGQIQEVLVDFNDEVRKGQVIARLDPQSIEYRVRQAQADVEAARAQVSVQQAAVMARRADLSRASVNLDEANRDLERKRQLVERNFISPAELDRARALVRVVEQDQKSAQAQLQLAESQVRNAEAIVRQRDAQLAQSRIDLERTVIRAPVDGVVIKRSIQPGQTVAASLQAPELFVIAQNLRDMQVDVSVDEAEVSRVQVGQRASFTVDAFPGRTFEGTVRQVRKAAQNVQNVITYTAVVSAANDSLSLLPGMTANVRVVTDVREGVLKVPNAALRFRPPGWTDAPAPRSNGPASAATAAKSASAAAAGGAAPGIAVVLQVGGPAVRPPSGGAGNAAQTGAAGAAGAAGGQLRAFRDRLERELSLSDAQRTQLDGIFAAQRERFAALRDAPEAERAKLAERNRAELRAQVEDILDERQKRLYAEILIELAGRNVARGRVFVPGPGGSPQPVELRLGLSDGSATEVVAVLGDAALAEGQLVYIGTLSGSPSAAGQQRPAGSPRFSF